MIPAQPDADTPGSERRVLDCLSVALPESWTVFHARRFTLPSRHGDTAVTITDLGSSHQEPTGAR
jgi:hypothetical protein